MDGPAPSSSDSRAAAQTRGRTGPGDRAASGAASARGRSVAPGDGRRVGAASGSDRRPGRPGTGRPALDETRRAEIDKRAYDPRREERRKASRLVLPDDVDARMLDPEVRRELRSLARETADLVARHLVVTGRTLDEDPALALTHARAARAMAGRVGVVREASGLAAYAAGEWTEALSELRAARRITGRPEHLAVLADCERALGRPERALAYADDPEVAGLTQDERVELVIVLAGARRDLRQVDAAVLLLQEPARRTTAARPWAPRLWYAYADALLAAGRTEQARTWFGQAASVDVDGHTDAGDRLLELDGIVLEDLDEDLDEDQSGLPEAELAAYVAEVFPRPLPGADPAGVPGAAPLDVPGAALEPDQDVSTAGQDAAVVDPVLSPPAASLMPLFASAPAPPDDEPGDEPGDAPD